MSIKKISFTLVALFVLLVTSLLLVSCGGNENKKIDYSKTNGTYYRFVDEELDKNEFFTLDNGKWKHHQVIFVKLLVELPIHVLL